jgi:hypothetical protein
VEEDGGTLKQQLQKKKEENEQTDDSVKVTWEEGKLNVKMQKSGVRHQ